MNSRFQLAIVISAAAALMTGCQQRECYDQFGNRLPDSQCRTRTGGGYIGGVGGRTGYYPAPAGSTSSGTPRSTTPSSSGTARGGFGGGFGFGG